MGCSGSRQAADSQQAADGPSPAAVRSPCEANLYSDARAALKILVDGFGLKPERDIVVFGKSLGSCHRLPPSPPKWTYSLAMHT